MSVTGESSSTSDKLRIWRLQLCVARSRQARSARRLNHETRQDPAGQRQTRPGRGHRRGLHAAPAAGARNHRLRLCNAQRTRLSLPVLSKNRFNEISLLCRQRGWRALQRRCAERRASLSFGGHQVLESRNAAVSPAQHRVRDTLSQSGKCLGRCVLADSGGSDAGNNSTEIGGPLDRVRQHRQPGRRGRMTQA